MRKLLSGLFAVALVTVAGCGGGSDSNDCGDVGRKAEACFGDPAAEVQAECQAMLDAAVCDGSKQDAIDCIVAMSCEDLDLDGPDACLEAQGCTMPAVQ
jgi:hypothetical protein